MDSHGAGRSHQTLSDLVKGIEYVDCNGKLQTISIHEPAFLSAASGCFGLIGIITHIVLQLDPMRYALMRPLKLDAMRAIPPPEEYLDLIPYELRITQTEEERAADIANFEKRASNDYYAEWFWFPYSLQIWVNTWDPVDDPTGALDYPTKESIDGQVISQWAMNLIQQTSFFKHGSYGGFITTLICKSPLTDPAA